MHTLLTRIRSAARPIGSTLASDLVKNLEELSSATDDHLPMVRLAIDSRDTLFRASSEPGVQTLYLPSIMAICAHHWEAENPVEMSRATAMADVAYETLLRAASDVQARGAIELGGMAALLYRASALAGQDVIGDFRGIGTTFGGTKFLGAIDATGRLDYLECGSAYNVNAFLRIEVPGAKTPLILAGEAKGGASHYGWVHGPISLLKSLNLARVSQRDPLYALTRAHYMAQDRGRAPESMARRDAGRAIQAAFGRERFLYLAARGQLGATGLTVGSEIMQCR